MTEVSKKYQDIFSTGKSLFWKFGLRRVTVEEICTEAGVSKMTFYKYFRNKDTLALEIMNTMINETKMNFIQMMDSDIPFEEKVRGTMKLKMDAGGSVSKEFLADLYSGDYPALSSLIEKMTRESLELITSYYRKAQAKGEIRKDLKIEFLLYLIDQMIVMLQDEKLTVLYETGGDLIYEITNFFFYGILPRTEK